MDDNTKEGKIQNFVKWIADMILYERKKKKKKNTFFNKFSESMKQ